MLRKIEDEHQTRHSWARQAGWKDSNKPDKDNPSYAEIQSKTY